MKEIDAIKIDHNFKHGDHTVTLLENDDPETLKVTYCVNCRYCRNYVRTSLQLKLHTKESRIKTINKLYDSFRNSVVESCKEAKLLGIIAHIHNT
jgi:hypothetical protein